MAMTYLSVKVYIVRTWSTVCLLAWETKFEYICIEEYPFLVTVFRIGHGTIAEIIAQE